MWQYRLNVIIIYIVVRTPETNFAPSSHLVHAAVDYWIVWWSFKTCIFRELNILQLWSDLSNQPQLNAQCAEPGRRVIYKFQFPLTLSLIQPICSRWLWKYLSKYTEKLCKCRYNYCKELKTLLQKKKLLPILLLLWDYFTFYLLNPFPQLYNKSAADDFENI